MNIDLSRELSTLYQKAGDVEHLYKTKSQNETKLNEMYGNGSNPVTHFVIIASNS